MFKDINNYSSTGAKKRPAEEDTSESASPSTSAAASSPPKVWLTCVHNAWFLWNIHTISVHTIENFFVSADTNIWSSQ